MVVNNSGLITDCSTSVVFDIYTVITGIYKLNPSLSEPFDNLRGRKMPVSRGLRWTHCYNIAIPELSGSKIIHARRRKAVFTAVVRDFKNIQAADPAQGSHNLVPSGIACK